MTYAWVTIEAKVYVSECSLDERIRKENPSLEHVEDAIFEATADEVKHVFRKIAEERISKELPAFLKLKDIEIDLSTLSF